MGCCASAEFQPGKATNKVFDGFAATLALKGKVVAITGTSE